jgi:Flp pilus assembly protein TadG
MGKPSLRDRQVAPTLRGDASGRLAGDTGYALIMTALLLVPLMVFTAFAIDVGAWYAQAARTQRMADAAALAGAVWLPRTDLATDASNDALKKNWTGPGPAPQCTPDTCKTVIAVDAENRPVGVQWQVKIGAKAPVFFSAVLGNVVPNGISRTATAAVNPAVPLGSPWATFGNNLDPGCHNLNDPCAAGPDSFNHPQPNLWAAIQAPYASHQDGDPYTTRCWGDTVTSTSCSDRPTFNNNKNFPDGAGPGPVSHPGPDGPWNKNEYHPDGYLYAVKVLHPGPITIEVYDASCDKEGADTLRGDIQCDGATPTDYQLYDKAASDFQIDTTPGNALPACRLTAPEDMSAGTAPHDPYKNQWHELCTINAEAGIYPLRVRNDNIPPAPGFAGCPFTTIEVASGCTGNGFNSYALRVKGAETQLFAIDNMSIWNSASGTASFHLADIEPQDAGKQLEIDLYDPGDANQTDLTNATLSITQPSAAGSEPTTFGGPDPSIPVSSCTWRSSDALLGLADNPPGVVTSSPGCSIQTRTSPATTPAGQPFSRFNDKWVKIIINIPADYTCPLNQNNCWWKVKYDITGGTLKDRTVWQIKIVGDPVHLTQ